MKKVIHVLGIIPEAIKEMNNEIGIGKKEFLISILLIVFMEYIHSVQRQGSIRNMFSKKPIWFRWTIYYILTLVIIFLGVFEKISLFIFSFNGGRV